MRRQLSLVLLSSVSSLLATNAWAVDGVLPNFAGAYVGAAVGVGGQRVHIDNQTLGTEFRDRETGATAGGFTGYNWFCSGFVFGVETGFNWLNTSPTAYDIEIGPTALTETTGLKSRLDWFGTLRGRAGSVVQENWLLYFTGGLAYAQVDHTLSDNCVGCGNSPLNLGPFQQTNTDTKAGWTVGGGTEYLYDTHWLLRAEALYVDLGSQTHTYVVTAPAGTGTAIAKWHDQFWVARLGLSYAFDPFGAP
jgi:outer membrane immunogenic protein